MFTKTIPNILEHDEKFIRFDVLGRRRCYHGIFCRKLQLTKYNQQKETNIPSIFSAGFTDSTTGEAETSILKKKYEISIMNFRIGF